MNNQQPVLDLLDLVVRDMEPGRGQRRTERRRISPLRVEQLVERGSGGREAVGGRVVAGGEPAVAQSCHAASTRSVVQDPSWVRNR